jgi:hypothetical protein
MCDVSLFLKQTAYDGIVAGDEHTRSRWDDLILRNVYNGGVVQHIIIGLTRALLCMPFALGTVFADTSWPSANTLDDNAILANILSYTVQGGWHSSPAPTPQADNYNLPGASYSPQDFGGDSADNSILLSLLSFTVHGWTPPVIAPPVSVPVPVLVFPSASLPLTPVWQSATVNELIVDNPEPGTWGAIALGFVFLVFLMRRARKSHVRCQ